MVPTSDNKIWQAQKIYVEITKAIGRNRPFELDFLCEGPDVKNLGIYDFLEEFDFPLENITLLTANALEYHSRVNVRYLPPMHLLENAKKYMADVPKHSGFRHFGLFVGRSNAPRLRLASYIDKNYPDKIILSYHWNLVDDFHTSNIGLEDLIQSYGVNDLEIECAFLKKCPVRIDSKWTPVHIDKTLSMNPAQQLFQQDGANFTETYRNFFVEIVCESYFTGQTFFPTEKIFRPMLLKTPFIVQGPQNFLQGLQALGFKTFDHWWDEGYSEDPHTQQIIEIKRVLDGLASKTNTELFDMYREMQDILEHNQYLALHLKSTHFQKYRHETISKRSS